jgi:DNA mismatch endonuclease (patch repair protein)
MSGIRSENTKPEILTRSALHRLGYRFRLGSKVAIKGQKRKIKPDIVLRKYKVVVFTHSCFFHQHSNCKLAYSDRHYSDFWLEKFQKNKARDERVTNQLLSASWRVAIIWECGIREKDEFAKIISNLDIFIRLRDAQIFESAYYKK